MSPPAAPAAPDAPRPQRPRLQAPVSKRLRWVLAAVLGLFALLSVNSTYLAAITFQQWSTGRALENQFYLWMFLLHLVLGIALLAPFVVFGILHWLRGRLHPNRRAIAMGWVLLITGTLVLATGVLLMRVDVGGVTLALRQTELRLLFYWLHVITPVAAVWAFVLHRLAGRKIRWRTGGAWALAAVVFTLAISGWHRWEASRPGPSPKDGAAYFEPSLARTANGAFISAQSLMMNEYCLQCHPDAYESWSHSVHAASSFNNPAYAFSVRETRAQAFSREQSVQDARFCAGCHDPVPFFSGAFEHPRFDDPGYDVSKDPLGSASITCTSCHSIVHIESTRGNADFVIEESPQYPFTFSESPFLKWVNRQLVKAKPSFHARTFLKPEVHRAADGAFCATCHKVFLPEELNDYHWLPGQNHYDSFRLSAVSGHGIQAWRFPATVERDCNGCHMPAFASADFGAKRRGPEGAFQFMDHTFAAANTAAQEMSGLPGAAEAVARVVAFNKGVMRTDIVALRPGATLEAEAVAPLAAPLPALERGAEYVLDIATRAVKMGHEFTQGTADSNEVWLDVAVETDGAVLGRSGALGPGGEVDPWSKFLNVFMLDRNGLRIDRRNPQDIFTPLYNHQIPPGGADVTHYRFRVPEDAGNTLAIKVELKYRKFDLTYMRHVMGPEYDNTLPIVVLASDRIEFPVAGGEVQKGALHGPEGSNGGAPAERGVTQDGPVAAGPAPGVPGAATQVGKPPAGERLYDWGIGLFREAERAGGKGTWSLVDAAFARAAAAGEPKAWVARARAALLAGRIPEAGEALRSAVAAGAPPQMVAYWSAHVDLQQGELVRAIEGFRAVLGTAFPEARAAGFDFSRDDRVQVDLATALWERSRQIRGDAPDVRAERTALLREAEAACRAALALDSQRAGSWYVLAQVAEALDEPTLATDAFAQYERFRPDDNARDSAVNAARIRYPAANHAAEGVAIYDLQRSGAYGLPDALARQTGAGVHE